MLHTLYRNMDVLRRRTAAIVLFNGLLMAWHYLGVRNHVLSIAVDNVLVCGGPLLVAPWCLGWRWRDMATLPRRGPGAGAGRPTASSLGGLSILGVALGQLIWTYYIVTLHAHARDALQPGLYGAAAVLVGLLVLRQVVAAREIADYARRIAQFDDELHAVTTDNRALSDTNAHLEVMATIDALTCLPNRTLLQQRMQETLRTAERTGAPVAFLLMDLDGFKEINDTLGHHYGDLLLQQVAERLRSTLRATDTVARLGGDEFGVLLPGTDAAGAMVVVRSLLAVLDAPFLVEGQAFDVGASIGVALSPEHSSDAATLLRQADVAMYAAKGSHGSHAVYDAARDQHTHQGAYPRLAVMSELRQALAEERLLVYYQPLIDLESGQVSAVEALVRWPHPERGFIPPDQFIPLAEQSGLITPLTEWVLETALRQCRTWHRVGWPVGVQVNLSARLLHDLDLPDRVASLLQRYELAARYLTLEITESALMVDPGRALSVLTRLSDLGVRSAIDDFGTGYSSLGYLKRLPVDEVKIDKNFVLGMRADGTDDDRDMAIVCSVIAMAHTLGLAVVAEGVETRHACDTLQALQCDTIQGYYMSRPLPAQELERWARTSPWSGQAAAATA